MIQKLTFTMRVPTGSRAALSRVLRSRRRYSSTVIVSRSKDHRDVHAEAARCADVRQRTAERLHTVSGRARAAARQVQEETLPHISAGPFSSAQALLDYDSEEPVDLLLQGVSSAPRDVESGEARSVADILTFDDHAKTCERCRAADYASAGRGLVRLTREMAARRPRSWLSLCLEGKRLFIDSWTALGLGLPEYAL
jgi:hypothetical protein